MAPTSRRRDRRRARALRGVGVAGARTGESWDWPRGLLAVALFLVQTAVGAVFFSMTDPDLARARTSVRVQTSADRWATLLIVLLMGGWFLAAASDVHLGPLLPAAPPAVSLSSGLGVHLLGFGLIVWTFR